MVKRQRFTTVLLLFIVVFSIGIIVGNNLATTQVSQIDSFLKQSELSTESYLLEEQLFEGLDPDCELATTRLADLSQELWQLGKLLGTETAQQDLGEVQYDFLKRKYHLMQVRTILLHKRLADACEQQSTVIVFYFSRQDPASQEQGEILDAIVEKHGIHVFAIEFGYAQELAFMEQYYELTTTPALIINFDTKKEGLTSAEEIEAVIAV